MRAVTCVAAAAMLLIPVAGLSQDPPWHATLRLVEVRSPDSSSSVVGSSATLSADPSPGLGIAIGYRFSPSWAVEASIVKAGLGVTAESPEWASFEAVDGDLTLAVLTLQYHPFVTGRVRPYLGIGAHLASFSGLDPTPALEDTGLVGVACDDSVSVSLELGARVDLSERLSIDLNAAFHDVATDVDFQERSGLWWSPVRFDIDPWTLAAGVTVRF